MTEKEKLAKAFDSATLSWKLVTLNNEQADAFVTYLKDESVLLKSARYVKMTKPTKTIAKLFVNGKFLYPGNSNTVDESKDTNFNGPTLELVSKLVRGNFMITDDELEDNIEWESVADTMMRLITKKVWIELEEIALYSRKRANPLSCTEMFDWFKYLALKNGHVVDANDSGVFTDRYIEKAKFSKAIKSLPTSYRQDSKFIVSSGTYIDYSDLYDTIADVWVRNELRGKIAGKGYIEAPLMREDEPVLKTSWISTTVASTAAAGQKVINVTSGAWITAWMIFVTNKDTELEQTHVVASVSTNAITMVDNLTYSVASASTFKQVLKDWSDVIFTNPLNLIYGVQTGGEWITFETARIPWVGYRYHFKMRADFAVENDDAIVIVRNTKIR